MAQTYVAATKFTAIDKFSSVVNKMNKTTNSFSGTIAKLGGVIGGLAIGQQIVDANLQAEKSFQSLSAVTGLGGKAFDTFKVAAEQTANATGMLIGDTAKAMELIGSQKPELLASAAAMQQVTEAAITLSRASGEDLAASAGNLTGIMNQFNLGAEMASKSINVLAAGTVAGAASIADVAESLKNVGTVASMSNMSLEDTVATLQALSLKKITGAEAGTKLRGVILKLKEAGIGYASGQFKMNDALLEAQTKMSKLTGAKAKDAFASKIFGAENINAALVMIDSIKTIKDMTVAVTGSNSANEMAAKNINTLAFQVEELKNKFLNLFTATDKDNTAMNALKGTLGFLIKNLDTIIPLIVYAGGVWATYTVAMWAITTATAAWNGTLLLNPIGLVVLGVIALISLVAVIVKKWESWGAMLVIFMGPLGKVISLVVSFYRNWDMIVKAFKTDGIIAGLKAIGAVLLDAIIRPLRSLLITLAKIPGMGKMLNPVIAKLDKISVATGINPNTGKLLEKGQFMQNGKLMEWKKRPRLEGPLNPDAANVNSTTQRLETIQRQNMTIYVKPVDGASATTSGMKDINAKVSPTLATPR